MNAFTDMMHQPFSLIASLSSRTLPRKEKYKQTSLFRYFYIKKKPSQKQTTLFRYFGHSAGAA